VLGGKVGRLGVRGKAVALQKDIGKRKITNDSFCPREKREKEEKL